jgi:hypothetical protein
MTTSVVAHLSTTSFFFPESPQLTVFPLPAPPNYWSWDDALFLQDVPSTGQSAQTVQLPTFSNQLQIPQKLYDCIAGDEHLNSSRKQSEPPLHVSPLLSQYPRIVTVRQPGLNRNFSHLHRPGAPKQTERTNRSKKLPPLPSAPPPPPKSIKEVTADEAKLKDKTKQNPRNFQIHEHTHLLRVPLSSPQEWFSTPNPLFLPAIRITNITHPLSLVPSPLQSKPADQLSSTCKPTKPSQPTTVSSYLANCQSFHHYEDDRKPGCANRSTQMGRSPIDELLSTLSRLSDKEDWDAEMASVFVDLADSHQNWPFRATGLVRMGIVRNSIMVVLDEGWHEGWEERAKLVDRDGDDDEDRDGSVRRCEKPCSR